MSKRQAYRNVLPHGLYETIAYKYTVPSGTGTVASAANAKAESYNPETQTFTDVTSDVMNGSISYSGNTITLPYFGRSMLLADTVYRLAFDYGIGTNTYDAFMWVDTSDSAIAFTYYVDSVNGDDDNAGTTIDAPFATIAKLLTEMAAGESVGLARGSHWREQLSLPGNNCTVASYGSGARPILDASNVASGWAKTAGQTNVYEVSITPEWGVSNWLNIWEDDAFLTRAASIAACDSTAGSYYPSGSNGTITLYVHTTGSDNPATNGSTYEYSQRLHGLLSYGYSGCSVTGIHMKRNLSENGSLKMGDTSTITDCVCSDGSKHNLYYGDGSILTDVIAQNAYYGTTSHSLFVFNADDPASQGVTHTNCTATADNADSLATGFYGHRNVSGDFGAVVYSGCTATNMQLGFECLNAGSVALTNCTYTGNTSSGSIGLRASSAVTHTLTDCTFTMTGGRLVSINIASAAIVISGGTWTLNAITNGGMIYGILAYSVNVQGLTLAGGTYSSVLFYATHADASIYARNNAYCVNITRCYDLAVSSDLDSDNNQFYDDSTRNRVGGTDYLTIAAYQVATGQDANSTIGGC